MHKSDQPNLMNYPNIWLD